ncbi:hypothetical protein [Phaffia rhodozyma]|uniref:Uncharacterized protein n=1 Tax=Phaffia rhodozyma TaxID=264483 RepID=A0A0F7SSS3_PHARH|nr:hypothetical protein [Phaffia rhodozyma]
MNKPDDVKSLILRNIVAHPRRDRSFFVQTTPLYNSHYYKRVREKVHNHTFDRKQEVKVKTEGCVSNNKLDKKGRTREKTPVPRRR